MTTAAQYVATHGVEEAIAQAVIKTIKERPENPLARISEELDAMALNKVPVAAPPGVPAMAARSFSQAPSKRNNILLMTDGYKFSHHKQYPCSWMPECVRPIPGTPYAPPVLFPGSGSRKGSIIENVMPVPGEGVLKLTIITNVSTAVVDVKPAKGAAPDITFTGAAVEYTGGLKSAITLALAPEVLKAVGLPDDYATLTFSNVDESKNKRGSQLNTFEGGYNVSYFTCRGYKDQFDGLASESTGDHIVFFGLQYLVKEYLTGAVVTEEKVTEAEAFVARYMADVRVAGPSFAKGFDYTMFPRGDWMAMVTGDYDGTGVPVGAPGVLPIKIEALPEGSLASPGVCLFKLTNTHPRFFWLPNFLETLLVQVWYPTTVASQAREFRKTIQAYSYLSQRVSQVPEVAGLGPPEFTVDNLVDDQLSVHIAQVFDLLDFGYRGVSSHETAALGSASYYVAGFEGSDTVAGSRMCLWAYEGFKTLFEDFHGATSVPAAEHSTITSWADMSPESDPVQYESDEYAAFANMFKQYMSSFCVSLVSDGFNIWNALANHWPSDKVPGGEGGRSMRDMLAERLSNGQLNLIRPDSGEAIETLPQLLTLLTKVLPEHWMAEGELPPLTPKFTDAAKQAAYETLVQKIKAHVGSSGSDPFRRLKGQQMRILQGDGVALDTVGDMCASLLANGFCANVVHFGSGGGLLQKVNRDSLSCAFKCCAMYVGDNKVFPIGKDPIAGGKKSYAGNPCVLRGADGVLRNRGEYVDGAMKRSQPMSPAEFASGVAGDVLETTFLNGKIVKEQNFNEIRGRAKITKPHLESAIERALDNLTAKVDFLQTMSSSKAMAVRLAEAAHGAKWTATTAAGAKLQEMKKRFPEYASTFEALGLTEGMDSNAMNKHIKDKLVCDKKAAKAVLALVAEGDMAAAASKMGDKCCITL